MNPEKGVIVNINIDIDVNLLHKAASKSIEMEIGSIAKYIEYLIQNDCVKASKLYDLEDAFWRVVGDDKKVFLNEFRRDKRYKFESIYRAFQRKYPFMLPAYDSISIGMKRQLSGVVVRDMRFIRAFEPAPTGDNMFILRVNRIHPQ